MVTIAAGKYRILRRVGGGAFGEVYVVQLTKPPSHGESELFAAKFEPLKSSHQPHLFHEARVYSSLSRGTVTVGIPQCRWYGVEGDFNVLVMDLVGPSLSELLEYCHGRMSVKTVLMLADQMISRLEFIHSAGYLHRDLKPDNFAMGVGKRAHHLYLLDFGLAKRYADVKLGKHIPYREGKSLTGTARYVSINTHLGAQQSRRDDLEGVAFVLIYLVKGGLPWQNVKCTNKQEKYEKIKNMKIATPPQMLCAKLPACFMHLLNYARTLSFEQTPDYSLCRKLFSDEMEDRGWVMDYEFSWLEGHTATTSLSRTSSWAELDGGQGGASASGAQSPNSTMRRTDSNVSASMFAGSPTGSPRGSMRRRPRKQSAMGFEDDDVLWVNSRASSPRGDQRQSSPEPDQDNLPGQVSA